MIDAAIFDMDGIIFDTERLACDVWRSVSGEAGFEMEYRLFFSCVGLNNRDTKTLVLTEMGSDFPYDEIHERARERIKAEMDRSGPPEKPGIRTLMRFLADRGIPIALATSTSEMSARWMLERAGIADFFSAFAFGSEVKKGKPAPDIFLLARDRITGSSPLLSERIAVFEDSPAGLIAACDAGMRAVFVPDMVEPPDEVLSRVWKRIARIDEAANSDFYAEI